MLNRSPAGMLLADVGFGFAIVNVAGAPSLSLGCSEARRPAVDKEFRNSLASRARAADCLHKRCCNRPDHDLTADRSPELQPCRGCVSSSGCACEPLAAISHWLYRRKSRGQMLRRAFLAVALLCWAGVAFGGTVVDATGRSIVVPEQIAARASGRPASRHPAGSSGARSDARLDLAGVGQCACAACAGSSQTAAGSAPDRAGRCDGQDNRAEARPDPGLRHHRATLYRPGQGDAAAHGHSHRAAGWVPGGNPARRSGCSAAFCIARNARRCWPGSPRHCWHRRRRHDASLRIVCARGRGRPDPCRAGNRSGRDLHPCGLAACRSRRSGSIAPGQSGRHPDARS